MGEEAVLGTTWFWAEAEACRCCRIDPADLRSFQSSLEDVFSACESANPYTDELFETGSGNIRT